MTDKQLRLIYEYMGWNFGHFLAERSYDATEYTHPLDSNSAFECMQKMKIQGDWEKFYEDSDDLWMISVRVDQDAPESEFAYYLMNPINFFYYFYKYLERLV